MIKAMLAVAVLAVSFSAFGQQVIKIDSASSQAQVRRDDQGFSSCGVRVVAIKTAGEATFVYDFSMMFYVNGASGFAKFGTGQVSTEAMMRGSTQLEPVMPAPVSFWIARADQAKAVRPVKYLQGEDQGYTLAVTDGPDTLRAIDDIANGKTMQFNIRYKEERFDVVNQFSAQLSSDETVSYRACLAGIVERLKSQ